MPSSHSQHPPLHSTLCVRACADSTLSSQFSCPRESLRQARRASQEEGCSPRPVESRFQEVFPRSSIQQRQNVTMLRSLSKAAGSAAAAVAAVSGPVSAHVDSSAATKRSKSSLSHPSSGPFYMDDEYDFCQEDIAKGGELLSKLGGVPSQEEAEEATRELQTNFIKKTLGPNINEGPISEVESVSMLASNERCYNVEELTCTVVQKGSPSADQMQAVTSQGGNSVVTWCVDLLQHDPNVQAAVVSLARDPAIWKAFVNNEKVQELMQSRDMNPPQLNDDGQASGFNYDQERVNPFLVALHCVQNVVWQVMDTLVDLVNSVFGFVDRKLFGEQDSDPLDKTFKACMVLTILVLALVVIKRGPVVA